ncbi:syntaxin-124-like [Phalaenopsis equestris]|uniref:syntaxin-124-like n=1 Tax=Phalaenopsis equestris TaxID=78828 RepID=UPI0009E2FB15|nr:syntaxin-124-like [Phalaenopsis equestris]
MNDLFACNSFKKYNDLRLQIHIDDNDAGIAGGGVGGHANNLEKFFQDIEIMKEEIKSLEQLYRRLQDLNEETKSAHNAKTMKSLRARMDADTDQVLRRAKSVKQKLESLDRANKANRSIHGCEQGSSVDRTRTSVVAGLGKRLKDLMDDFQSLRARMADDYREMVGRRYYTVTGEQADEETIEILISSGKGESFFQKAIQEQGKGEILDAISEIQERHDAVKEIEKSLLDLHQVFLDMAVVVEAQGQQINDIESHVARASSFVRSGVAELEQTKGYQKRSRKWYCMAFLLGTVLVVLLLLPFITAIVRSM